MAPLRRDDAVGFLAWHNPWVDGSLLLLGVIRRNDEPLVPDNGQKGQHAHSAGQRLITPSGCISRPRR